MIFGESHARLLLIAHTVLAAALVASTTHLVIWMRHFPRGRFQRIPAIRRFSFIAATLFTLTFLLGNIIYPIYKVRVRTEYFEQASAVVRDYRNRVEARRQAEARHRAIDTPGDADRVGRDAPSGGDAAGRDGARTGLPDRVVLERSAYLLRETAKIARWFDVKEHWVAFGMVMSIGCALLMRSWNPKRHGQGIASIAFLMALSAALTTWLGAIVGVVVSSYRSIGGL